MLTIVMGPSCAGKSTYINNNFDESIKTFDIFDYQQRPLFSVDDVFETYKECSKHLCQALKEDPSQHYVLEHTLLKRIRREWYLENIRKVYDGPIEIICLKPSVDTLNRNYMKRFCTSDTDSKLNGSLDVLELPTMDEGYDKVTIIEV